MIRSMTGHGVGHSTLGSGRVSVEVRAVNHRYLDVRVRLPTELASLGAMVEERARSSLRRGRVEVLGWLDGGVVGPPALDLARARAAFEQLCELRDALRPEEPVPLSLLAAVPDLFVTRDAHGSEAVSAALLSAADEACTQVWRMREREGAALAEDLRAHLDVLSEQLTRVKRRVDRTVDAHRDRLRRRIERLLADTRVALDPGRLEHEIALLADRADVSEEIARLESHAEQLRRLLDAETDAAGKRLDFLMQEMSRETNTIGSKSADADLAHAVVEMKAAISRMREQAQNVL